MKKEIEVEEIYWKNTLKGIESNEDKVKTKMEYGIKEDIKDKMCPWVQYVDATRSMEMKYFKSVSLYWQMKSLSRKYLMERKNGHQELIFHLDEAKDKIKNL